MFLLFFAWTCFAQDWLPVKEIRGKACHELEIKDGMSMLHIVSMLQIPLDTFKIDNPTLNDSLTQGTIILIRAARKNIVYLVVAGDTPFGISKKMYIPLDSLFAKNPGLKTSPLKIGQEIMVPNGVVRLSKDHFSDLKPTPETAPELGAITMRSFDFEDSVLWYKVRSGESINSISKRFMVKGSLLKELNNLNGNKLKEGDVLKIPLFKDTILSTYGKIPPKKFNTQEREHSLGISLTSGGKLPLVKNFKVGVFLPFGGDTVSFPLRGFSKAALDFYMGASMAIDSLNRQGCQGEIRFFDYWSPGESVQEVISSGWLADCDVIISPMHANDAVPLVEFCQQKKIPLLYQAPKLPLNYVQNRFLYSVTTETDRQLACIAQLSANQAAIEQVVWYQTNLPSDTSREKNFGRLFNQLSAPKNRLISADMPLLKALLNSGKPTTVVSLSNDKKAVQGLLTQSKLAAQKPKIIGLREWTEWKELNANVDNESDFYFFSTSCMDYESLDVKEMHKTYRSLFHSDLSKFSLFGYDVILGFVGWSVGCERELPYKGLFVDFEFPKPIEGYHSNFGLSLCRFKEFKQEKNARFE